jgi:outer membrane protein assembly factor BamB
MMTNWRAMNRRSLISLTALALAATGASAAAQSPQSDASWTQWGGPDRNFIIAGPPLAESWPDDGPPVLWSRPLGVGHSSILYEDGVLYTMYRLGSPERSGPWNEAETVIALDAATGETLWEHTYSSALANFSFGAGPHGTPLIVGERLFTVGTYKKMFAFDKRSGEVLWSIDMVDDLGAPPLGLRAQVKAGYGCNPVAWRETVICQVGGPGQSVVAFNQADGEIVWRSGDFLTSQAPPALIDVDGQTQLVVVAGASVNGLDPDTGEVLWAVAHDAGNDINLTQGLWGDDNILFVSSAYRAGSHALRLTRDGEITDVEELWYDKRLKLMFLNPVRVGDWVYGTEGEFGPKFMIAINVVTGEPAWRARGFGHASLLRADGKFLIMDEDGDLVLARMSPEGIEELARASIFQTTSWTVPTLVGTTLYARDRAEIKALDLAPRGLR